jgi:PKD repeat protein
MTHAAKPSALVPPKFRTVAVLAVLGLLVLGATLGAAMVSGEAPTHDVGSSGLATAGPITCPNSEGNNSGVLITTNQTVGPAPLSVQFCSFSPLPVKTSTWTFGDGNSSAVANTTHTFTQPGNYSVHVHVTFTTGGNGISQVWIDATGGSGPGGGNGTGNSTGNGTGPGGNGTGNGTGNFSVVANAYPTTAIAPAEINFSASVSGGVAPYTYQWYFGDGGNGSGPYPTHLYESAGTYTAWVYARDNVGAFSNNSVQVTISTNQSGGNGSPLHLAFSATPSRGAAPLNVQFWMDGSGGTTPYKLLFCATEGVCGLHLANYSGGPVIYDTIYTMPGNYTATATLQDANGTQTIGTIPIVVTTGAPFNVTFQESTPSGPTPLAVGFLATVTGGTAPYSIQWNWGDGTVGSSVSGVIVAHAYTVVGSYAPTLVVTDAVGHSVTVALGVVNVTATPSVSTSKPGGLLPAGGTAMVVLEYLGIAAVGGLVSGLGVGLLLRRRRLQQEGAHLVQELETTAGRAAGPANGTEGER